MSLLILSAFINCILLFGLISQRVLIARAQNECDVHKKSRDDYQSTLHLMCHEIRSSLSGLIGIQEKLIHTRACEEHDLELLAASNSCARRTLETLEQIVDYSKIESQTLAVLYKACNLPRVVLNIFNTNKILAKQSGTEIQLEIDQDISTSLLTDEIKLRRVIQNLLFNALKHTPNGKVTLKLYLLANDHFAQHIHFQISDTGHGFNPADIGNKKMNSPLPQGLGLVICKHLICAMGGQLEIHSKPNLGTTISFSLCLKRSLEASHLSHALDIYTSKHSKKILLVDDHLAQLESLQYSLQDYGHEVITASNMSQAIHLLDKDFFDAVITDFHLDDQHGLDLIRYMRTNKRHQSLAIGLSANQYAKDVLRSEGCQFDQVFTKPVTSDEISSYLDLYDQYLLALEDISQQNLSLIPKLSKQILQYQLELQRSYDLTQTTNHDHNKLQQQIHKVLGGAQLLGDPYLSLSCQEALKQKAGTSNFSYLHECLIQSNKLLMHISQQHH